MLLRRVCCDCGGDDFARARVRRGGRDLFAAGGVRLVVIVAKIDYIIYIE